MTGDLGHDRLSVLVHEVRSPVAALSAIAETVSDSPGDWAVRRELVELVLAASRAVERIVLDVAVASVRLEPLDLGALARDSVAAFVLQGADVIADLSDDDLAVDGDPVRLQQAVDNLVTNAIRHGGPALPVVVRVFRRADRVQIAVRDEGPGISARDHARIFEPGVRLDASARGSGLGLALVRAIVEAHSGTVAVDSGFGEGTTFSIELPAARP